MVTTAKPKVGLITACASSRMIAPKVRVEDMPLNLTMKEALDWWHKTLAEHSEPQYAITPREQYRGTGFSTLVRIQDIYPVDLRVVTGGMGLIDLDEPIIPYDFTASKKEEHNIHQKVTKEPFVQTVWWRGINNLRLKGLTPVADFVREHELTAISAGKIFLRYIAEDLLSLGFDERKKVRILLTASSLGSVPAQLHSMIIPFARNAVAHMPGNRNDINHRAAQLFFQKCADEPTWVNLSLEEHAKLFASHSLQGNQSQGMSTEQLQTIFEDHPGYLQLPMDEAYLVVKRAHGNPGGKMFFRGVFRLATQQVAKVQTPDVVKGAEVLKGMDFLQNKASATPNAEDKALEGLQIFAAALRQVAPNTAFGSADIVKWAETYYDGIGAPEMLKSPMQLSYLIRANLGILGFQQAGKQFMLKQAQEQEVSVG
jgi:hypothetical protein